jgi:hypothetical protein
VIFIPKDKSVSLFSQNFEYDLADSQKMIRRYIDKKVKVSTEEANFEGKLVFSDHQNYGLLNETTNELTMISVSKVINIMLTEMPDDFYTKPTLRWQLQTGKDGKYPADLSYLTKNIEWRATYNAVLKKNDFTLNSWVTINNRSGKDFKEVVLKLIAGDVQTYQAKGTRNYYEDYDIVEMNSYALAAAPSFEERAFSDYRIYTLDQKADIDNNQEKQLRLYELKTVKFTRKYQYTVNNEAVDVMVFFKNSKADGLGVPLPKGNINFYEIDEKDGTQQFVGVSSLTNTSENEERNLKIGTAFDIVAETKITNSSYSGRTSENDYEVKLTNNKKETIEVEVLKQSYGSNVQILNPRIPFEKKDAFNYIFKVSLTAGQTRTWTCKERPT